MIPEELIMLADVETPANPFPGLRPFEFGESHLYFGRDGQSDNLIRKLAATRFVAVVGTSGSGKSSLVRAGLLPDLFSGFMASAGSHWRVCLMRPSNDPLGNLARALSATSVFGSDIEENARIQTAITEATLRRGSLGLVEVVRQNRMPSNESLLVVVDQFEELFRFARVSGSEQYRFEAAAFVKLLLEAARQRDQAIYVVLTMRSDFLGDCSLFWDLPEAINEGQYLIPRMTRDQRAEAITGPVAVCGGQITQRLVNRLLNDTGDSPDLLPILQHALMRTWEKWAEDHAEGEAVDLRHYEVIGTMSDALSHHADEAWGELPDERRRQIAEKVFKALTEKGEDNREVRRPTELRELCALTGATPSEVMAVIEVFRREGRSFLMPPPSVPLDEESLIDISHESLIRNWQRLKEWVDEESSSAQIYIRLAETAVLYEKGQAGLWRDPDLQLALDWRERSTPSAAWAVRYHPAFDSAISFLDASVEARDTAAREEEGRRRREIRRARVTAVVFFSLFMLSLVAFAYAYSKNIQAQEALGRVEEANKQANAQRVLAENEREIAREQSEIARRNEEAAHVAEEKALVKKKEAEESKAEAERQAEIARNNQRQTEAARRETEKQRATAVAAATKNRQLLYAADINLAQQSYDASNMRRGRNLLEEFLPDVPKVIERPGFEWFYLWNLYHREADTLEGNQKGVKGVAYSPDGRVFASVGADGTASLWDASSKSLLATLPGHTKAATALAFSPDGHVLATVSWDRTIKLWDVATKQELTPPIAAQEREISSVAFSPDGQTLATGGRDGILRLWDVATRKLSKALSGHHSTINAIAFSSDGKTLATGGADNTTRLWDIESGNSRPVTTPGVLAVALSPDGKTLVTGQVDHTVKLWNIETQELMDELKGHTDAVNSVKFSPDGTLLASGSSDRTVMIWRLKEKEQTTLKGHLKDVKAVTFSPDGRTIASGGDDGLIKLWDITSRKIWEQTPVWHESGVRSVVASPDGHLFATASLGDVRLWDSATHKEVASFVASAQAVWTVAFSPDGHVFAAGGQDKTVRLWDVASRQRLLPDLTGHTDTVTSVAFSPDGSLLATAGRDSTVRLWDAASHKELKTLDGYSKPVMCLAFSRDGRMLATGSGDGTIIVWDVVKQRELFRNNGHTEAVNSVAFSPDGRYLASASDDSTVMVWDMRKPNPLVARLDDHSDKVRAVAFSPDGKTLATGGDDTDVMLWETHLFKRLLTLKGHTNSISALAFSPDGEHLFTASFDQTVRMWRAASVKEVQDGH